MAVVTDRFVYVHIPKTGGTFVGTMVEAVHGLLRCKYAKITGGHEILPVRPSKLHGRPVLMGYRHPVDWLRSVWMHVKRSGGEPNPFRPMPYSDLVSSLAHSAPKFETFVEMIAAQGPLVSRIWDSYVHAYSGFTTDLTFLNTIALAANFMQCAEHYGWLAGLSVCDVTRVQDTICCLTHGASEQVPRVAARTCARLREIDPRAFEWCWY